METKDNEFEPIEKYELLTEDHIKMITRALHPIALSVIDIRSIDISKGAGVVNAKTKCVWTKKGNRITLVYDMGSFMASQSRGVDPLHDPLKR
jgi:hypothetical protein